MNSKRIILISGYAGSGKDEVGRFFGECFGKAFGQSFYINNEKGILKISKFAEKVKECAKKYYGWDGKKDEKGRKLLQQAGKIGREYDENLWVKGVYNELLESKGVNIFVITDWRFENEYIFLKDNAICGIIKIRVVSNRIDLSDTMYLDVSENGLPLDKSYYDYVIENNGTLDELKEKVKIIFDKIVEGD